MSAYNSDYVLVAKSLTQATITLKIGALLERIIIVPETTAAGAVTLYDANGTGEVALILYTGGTEGASLRPHVIELGIRNGVRTITTDPIAGWYLTTGNNVHCLCIGSF